MWKRFLATTRMSFKESNYFGVAQLLGNYVLKWLRLLALLMIWRSLLLAGVDGEGLSLEQMLAYTVLSAALSPLLDVRSPASSWIHEGTMLSLYQRPMGIFTQLVSQTIGSWGMQLLVFALPCLFFFPLLGINLQPSTLWAIPSLVLAVAQGFSVDFLFACLVIRSGSMGYQIDSLRNALTTLFTGALIPFAVLPFGIGEILAYTPFGTLAGAPLSIWVGLGNPAVLIPVQLAWTLVLWPVAIWCFRHSTERMVSFGG